MSQLNQLLPTPENNVIGPFTEAEWNILLGTKRTIAYMKKTDREFYAEAITMETANLREDIKGKVA